MSHNCFSNCLNCPPEEGATQHEFKLKKGLKCLTHAKQKTQQHTNTQLPTMSSNVSDQPPSSTKPLRRIDLQLNARRQTQSFSPK